MGAIYTVVNLEIIGVLKARGFKSIQFNLLKSENIFKSTVEVLPCNSIDFQLDSILLNSREILDYFDGSSPMAEYVINRDYL